MHIDLTGKTALVTGSARGIGQAIASKLAASGVSILLADVDQAALEESARAISPNGERIAAFAADLTEPEAPAKIVNAAIERFGSLDIIVNNAGYTWDSVIQKTTDEQFQAMLDIHIVAPFRILRAAAEFIRSAAKREKEEGRTVMRKVVNITSISGTDGNAGRLAIPRGRRRLSA